MKSKKIINLTELLRLAIEIEDNEIKSKILTRMVAFDILRSSSSKDAFSWF